MFDRFFTTTNDDDSDDEGDSTHNRARDEATDTSGSREADATRSASGQSVDRERVAQSAQEADYAITECGTTTVGETVVRATTVDNGPVAGADVRELFETQPADGEGPLWIGYDEDAHRGFREAPLPFDAMFRHCWLTGTTGYGKTTTLRNLMVQLAYKGHGFTYIDPKGQDSRQLLRQLPEDRLEDVVWVEPGAPAHDKTVGLNVLDLPDYGTEATREAAIEARVQNLQAVLDSGDYWGINLDSITETMGRAMLQADTQYSLIDLYFILRDADRRKKFADAVDDPYVQEFCHEIASMNDNTVRPLLKRLKSWVEHSVIRRIIAHRESTLDFRDVIDNDRIVIVRTPIENADVKQMISLTVLRNLWTAITHRATTQDGQPAPYFLVCDEFDDIASPTLDIEGMLARARSHRLSVTLACQYPSQLPTSTQKALQNNCDTMLAFSVNDTDDATVLMKRFQDHTASDLIATPQYTAWTKLPLENQAYSKPARIRTFPPYPPHREPSTVDEIIDASLDRYGTTQPSDTEIHQELVASGVQSDSAHDRAVATELAAAVRAVQLRKGCRSTNDWVASAAVEAELDLRLTHPQTELETRPDDLNPIPPQSSLLAVDNAGDETRLRLTAAGERSAEPDIGTVQSAGGTAHEDLLFDAEAALTERGFSVAICEQDSTTQPDATAAHSGIDERFVIEAETSTPSRPAKTLHNLGRAQAQGQIPIFVVRPGTTTTKWAARVENILATPVNERSNQPNRLYNGTASITFDGGANAHNGVTAVRPTTSSTETVWLQDDGKLILTDGDGTTFSQLESPQGFSKDCFPAYYSYDADTGQFTVHHDGEKTVYDSQRHLEEDWTTITCPFIPSQELPNPDYDRDSYLILIIPPDEPPLVYQEGEHNPIPEHPTAQNLWFSDSTPPQEDPADTPKETSPSSTHSPAAGSPTSDVTGDGVETFAHQFLTHQSDERIRQHHLYEAYKTWTNEHNIDATSKSWFARKLQNTLDTETQRTYLDDERVQFYLGLTLTQEGRHFLNSD